MSSGQVPGSLHEKFTLVRYIAQYMDKNLTEGGKTGVKTGISCNPNLAIIMHLTNGIIQVTNG